MTRDELEQIQTACHEWLRHDGARDGSRLTISASHANSTDVHVEVRSILTFDNVLIQSVVDCDTGVCYTKLIGPHGEAGEFIDTPLEMIAAAQSPAPEAAPRQSTERIAGSVKCNDRSGAYERPVPLIETHDIDGNPRPKYLLYSKGKLLGYSRLERDDSKNERYGRFHPDDDYYEVAEIFEEMVTAENEFLEVGIQEASGLEVDADSKIRNQYNELSDRIEALELDLTDEDGGRIAASRIKLEDRAPYYGDESERWLYVTLGIDSV